MDTGHSAKRSVEYIAAPRDLEKQNSNSDQPRGKGKRRSQIKNGTTTSKRKGKASKKIHIRLPPIESYQKEICFTAEAPGRVVVRLERLMGSDRIRPVDGKYMETLIQKLEEEEAVYMDEKIKLRKKTEKERHRQLVIAGLMEPGPGMEDLYNHPVFRVNRILNRLAKLDNNFTTTKPGQKLPPITPIDPFKDDDTGKFFCGYKTHKELAKQCAQVRADKKNKAQALHDEQLLLALGLIRSDEALLAMEALEEEEEEDEEEGSTSASRDGLYNAGHKERSGTATAAASTSRHAPPPSEDGERSVSAPTSRHSRQASTSNSTHTRHYVSDEEQEEEEP